MYLKTEVINNNNELYYLIHIKNNKIESTFAIEDVECGMTNEEVDYFILEYDEKKFISQMKRLTELYENVVPYQNGFKIQINSRKASRTTKCTVNVDLDQNGEIVSFEVI
jgi:hypothetical protein